MRLAFSIAVGSAAVLSVIPMFVFPPPLKVPPPREGNAHRANQFLSGPAESGKRTFSGNCKACHGAAGRGGPGGRLDTLAFARDFMRSRDLHDALERAIPAHAGLDVQLGAPGARQRFNDVERMGKYLREVRVQRARRSED